MTTARIRPFRPCDTDAVVDLWQRCGLTRPWNDPHADIARKASVQPELFLVAEADGAIVGVLMAGFDGHRGWLNYVTVDPAQRRTGLGTSLVRAAQAGLHRLGCPKVNLQIRAGNDSAVAFYSSLGYAVEDVISMGHRLADDTPQD